MRRDEGPRFWERPWRAVVAALLVLAALREAPAAAQPAPGARVLVLAPGGDAGLARRLGAAAREEAAEALGRLGLAPSMGPPGCADTECAAELLARGGAQHAVAVALWGRGARCERVAVTLLDGGGGAYGAEVLVESTDLAAAVGAAVEAALARAARGAGVSLRVSGSPEGATITLDRIPWGTLPHEALVPEGEHAVAVSADGYESQRRVVTVGADPVELDVRLAPVAITAPPADEPTPEAVAAPGANGGPDPLLLGVGAAVGVVGLASVGVGLFGLLSPVENSAGPAERERTDPAAAGAWLGVGAAALVGGVVLVVVGASSPGAGGRARVARTGGPSGFVISF